MNMPKLSGILETALYVSDLERAARFYVDVFGFKTLSMSDRLIALNVSDRSVLLFFRNGSTEEPLEITGGVIPPHGPGGKTHFAFSIEKEDFSQWQAHLSAKHVPIESVVNWPGGARSLYFRDPDEHLVELITEGFWQLG
jgi:catechol 2,3-dioxygenase-like lactoylglutathione lyase family enzyme